LPAQSDFPVPSASRAAPRILFQRKKKRKKKMLRMRNRPEKMAPIRHREYCTFSRR
jgi:hypothetical protein